MHEQERAHALKEKKSLTPFCMRAYPIKDARSLWLYGTAPRASETLEHNKKAPYDISARAQTLWRWHKPPPPAAAIVTLSSLSVTQLSGKRKVMVSLRYLRGQQTRRLSAAAAAAAEAAAAAAEAAAARTSCQVLLKAAPQNPPPATCVRPLFSTGIETWTVKARRAHFSQHTSRVARHASSPAAACCCSPQF